MASDSPTQPRLLERRPPEVDRLLDRYLLGETAPWWKVSPPRRALRDAVHFGVSMGSELLCAMGAAPGFVGAMMREGPYPKRMSFRKLPHRPEMADLTVLREANPGWVFREDFDPKKWVFVFLHGYVDNTGADRIAHKLASLGYQLYLVRYPFLHSVRELAASLREALDEIAALEPGKRLVPIGHSLGGCIWDDVLLHHPEVVEQHRMPLYIPLGSPHFGTLAAYFGVGQSCIDMRPGSDLVRQHLAMEYPSDLEIYPFVSRFDMLVLPIETALLKRGINYVLSETGHVAQIIRSDVVTAIEEVIASPPELLTERSEERPFYPSALAASLAKLPRTTLDRLGLSGILDYIGHDGRAERPTFRIRVMHHELDLGIFPALRRP